MNAVPFPQPTSRVAARLASRADLTRFLMGLTAEAGAESYMLLTLVLDQDRSVARILSSNWIHDAIELAGLELVGALAQAPFATAPGARPLSVRPSEAPALPVPSSGEESKLLEALGHREIYALKLAAGNRRLFLLLSSSEAGEIEVEALRRIQFKCGYGLSQMPDLLSNAALQSPLSERERECLTWVSEGKTTDEVATIIGVSSNTVNSYVTHAIRKLSASNRAMAIATAIRNGII